MGRRVYGIELYLEYALDILVVDGEVVGVGVHLEEVGEEGDFECGSDPGVGESGFRVSGFGFSSRAYRGGLGAWGLGPTV